MKLTSRAPALIICDAQNDLLEDDGVFVKPAATKQFSEGRANFYRACRALIDAAKAAGVPVIYACTMFRADKLDSALPVKVDGNRGSASHLVEGTWGAKVVDALSPQNEDIIIRKTGHSAFDFTPLHRVLKNVNADSVILAGGPLYTSINATGRAAAALGYMAFAVSDALYPFDFPHPEYLRMRTHVISGAEARQRLRRVSECGISYKYRPPNNWISILSESCVLLIDLQNGFVRREGFFAGSHEISPSFVFCEEDYRKLLSNNVRLINWAREVGVPVINVRTVNRPDMADNALYIGAQYMDEAPPLRCVDGDWNAEYAEEIIPTSGDIELVKHGSGAFSFTILDRMLRNLGVRQCFVTGGNIGGCLEETLRGGSALGYSMVAVRDALYRPGDPRLELMAEECEIVSTHDILVNRNCKLPNSAAT